MNFALALALCFTVAFAYKYEDSYLEHASVVNAKKTTWTAGYNSYFAGKDWKDVKRVLGTFLDKPVGEEKKVVVKDTLPDTFDSRVQWPACKNRISEIRDVSEHLATWAVSTAIVATDRTCIASNGTINVDLSALDVMYCCGYSCGGYPIQAMTYWNNTGLVTTNCYQNIVYPCDPNYCPPPKCVKTCQAGYPISWENDKHKASSIYYVTGGEAAIKQEIFSRGTVLAAFSVYSDFMHYTSGVYQHVSGSLEGGHTATIIGWGTENGIPYWLVKNQWGKTWGDNGYFKIRRGTDECGIESGVIAGLPIV